jgi:hypothetical protein
VPVVLYLSNQACTTWANPVLPLQVSTCLKVLQEAQATGPSTGFALQIFSKGAKHCDLSQADHSIVLEDCQTYLLPRRRSPEESVIF